jgi:hypothetical protein
MSAQLRRWWPHERLRALAEHMRTFRQQEPVRNFSEQIRNWLRRNEDHA